MTVILLSRILPLAMQSLLLAIMLKRKLRPAFPLFFKYTLINSAALFLGMILRFTSIQQPWLMNVDWMVSLISMVLSFGVLYEVFVGALQPYSALIDLGKMLFRWTAAFLLVAAFITAFATISAFAPDKRFGSLGGFEAVRLLVDHTLRLMQCGLLLLLLLFEKRLGLSWRSRGMAIALGLGFSSAFALGGSFIKGFLPAAVSGYDLDLLNATFYLGVTLFWVVSLMRPEAPLKNVLDSDSRVVVQRWNDVLTSARPPNNQNDTSFYLPGIEKAVERVLAKKMVN